MNIIFAEDELDTAITVSYVLKHSGHSVDVVNDGADALAKIQESPEHYDLLITDHEMKRLSGLDLVNQLRDTRYRGGIIVLSAFLTWDLKEAYEAAGVKNFINKPFDVTELREAVNVPPIHVG